MKKLLLTLSIILMNISGAISAYGWNEDFESEHFPPTGWTAYQVEGCKGFWNKVNYKSDAQLKQYIKGYTQGGDSCAHVNSSSFNNIGKINPSSWLITPAISISDSNYLHFMLSYNYGYNGSDLVTDETKKLKFEVLISTTSADTTTFTEKIYAEIPAGVKNWNEVTLDLSKYAGKTIYVAFHEYGTPQATPFLMNHLYIDDVKVDDKSSSDIYIASVKELSSGTITSQPLTVKVKNSGMAISNYKLYYKVGTQETVEETVNSPIENLGDASYTFTKYVELPANGVNQNIKIWCESDKNSNVANDTTSTSAQVFVNTELPYILGTTASSDFAASARRTSGGVIYGWGFYTTTNTWVYTSYATPSYLYTTKSYTLPKGKVKIKLYCTSTAEASMNVYLTQDKNKYNQHLVGTQALTTSLNATDNNFYIDVPEAGNYIISFLPTTTGQVAIFGLNMCNAYDDVMAQEIVSPSSSSMIAQADVPVTIKFKNDGLTKVNSVKVSYTINNATPIVETIASIESGETVEHTFATKADFSTVGIYNLVAWSELSTDGDIHNDSISITINSYSPKPFPYTTSFETTEDAAIWSSININGDDTYWGIENVGSANAIDGTHASYINYEATSVHNDFFVSPAITITNATNARVSFYYASKTTYGGSKLAVYLTQSLDPETILEKGIKLDEVNINRLAYNYFATPAQITEAGTYYIAIYNYGGKDAIFIDDFRFDTASEIALVGLSSSEKSSSFEINDCELKVSIKNCGVTDLTGGKITYLVYENNNNTLTLKDSFTEEYTATIKANSIFEHTFSKKVEITEPGTYAFGASVEQTSDSDTKNNSFACTGPTLYATRSIPYNETFETTNDRVSVAVNGGWQKGTNSLVSYQGTGLIQHTGKAAENGDWVYLNRVYITPGTYDFSFFWKTATSNVAENTSQNFSVYIGTDATPEAMTTNLFSADNAINATLKCTKELIPLTITEAGNYYIAVKCTTSNTLGNLNLDNFTISLPAEGCEITKNAPYKADFANNESEWYHYYPTNTSNQWKAVTKDDATYMSTSRTYTSYNTTWKTPGIYESPAFRLKKKDKINATFTYSMSEVTGTSLDGESKINLMLASKDHPDAFTSLVASGTESTDIKTATGAITINEDGVYYFGFDLESTVSTTFNLHSLTLALDSTTSVNLFNINSANTYILDEHNILTIYGNFDSAQVYNINGALAANINNATTDLSNLASGVYILKIASNSSINTGKIMIK